MQTTSDVSNESRIVMPVSKRTVATVKLMEAMANGTPPAMLLLFWSVPLAFGLQHGLANVIVVGALTALVSVLVTRLLMALWIDPLRRNLYREAARALAEKIPHLDGTSVIAQHRWSEPFPGTIAILSDGSLFLVDRVNGYAYVHMPATALRDATTILDTVEVASTRRATRGTIAEGSREQGPVFFGGRSQSVSPPAQIATLELRYRFPTHAALRTAAIAFGEDLRGAREFRAALIDSHVQASRPRRPSSTGSFL